MVFSSHIVSDVERLANKIWIVKDDRLYWQGDFDALKDSIVRLHIRARARAARRASQCPNALSSQRNGSAATVVVRDWSDELTKATWPSGSAP